MKQKISFGWICLSHLYVLVFGMIFIPVGIGLFVFTALCLVHAWHLQRYARKYLKKEQTNTQEHEEE